MYNGDHSLTCVFNVDKLIYVTRMLYFIPLIDLQLLFGGKLIWANYSHDEIGSSNFILSMLSNLDNPTMWYHIPKFLPSVLTAIIIIYSALLSLKSQHEHGAGLYMTFMLLQQPIICDG